MTRPTPLQIADAKAASGDAVLLFRIGEFYEAFDGDAQKLAIFCGLTVRRGCAGFPADGLEHYLAHLAAKGCRMAVCEKADYVSSARMNRIVESTASESQGVLFR